MNQHVEPAVLHAAPAGFYELRRGERLAYFAAKRVIDVAVVVAAAPVAVPLVMLCAGLLRLSGGKAFYTQKRLGKRGREFTMWKLQTMVPDADKVLDRYLSTNPEAKREWDENQKLARDPRITPLGRYLRKYSIDELPQLFNVFRGEMSIVGPRPMFPSQSAQYPSRAYFNVKPGLTGLWQIGIRNGCSFVQRGVLDTRYANTMSLSTDLQIMLRTLAVVVRGTGL